MKLDWYLQRFWNMLVFISVQKREWELLNGLLKLYKM